MAITFACEGCGKSFTVPDHLAGKSGTCKRCGEKLDVPRGSDSVEHPALKRPARPSQAGPTPSPVIPRKTWSETSAPAPSPGPFPPKPKATKKKSTSKGGTLHGSGGYNGDHLRHLIWIGIVVAFFLLRVFTKTSIRDEMRQAAGQRAAEEQAAGRQP